MNLDQRTKPTIRERIEFALQTPCDWILKVSCVTYATFLAMFRILPPSYLGWASRVKARKAYYRALRTVPAYGRFLDSQRTTQVPETDKDSYIRPYPTGDRCVGGSFFNGRTMIDESSGSTGTPYNWVRSETERHESHTFVSYFATYCFGREKWITINGFSMGAWATGINMGLSLQKNGIVNRIAPLSALQSMLSRRSPATSSSTRNAQPAVSHR